MRSSLFSGRGLGAAMAIMLAGAAFMPPITSRRQEVVPNQPGERLLPPPKPVKRKLTQDDIDKIDAAESKRDRKHAKRLKDQAAGGWVATEKWLSALAVRLERAGAPGAVS